MMEPLPAEAWLARLRARADAPPLRPRETLWWGRHRIGSVEPAVAAALRLPELRQERDGWRVHGDATPSLHRIALALRDAGHVKAWRDEKLAVCNEDGMVLGTIERGAVRALGITTQAVHLLGFTTDGRQWVQQRALDKATDPGLWDTLVGGMVPAGETVALALERETWEEAGLRFGQLQGLAHGGHVLTRRPSSELAAGYVVERIDWFRGFVPDGVVPVNQDGEVARFELLGPGEVGARLEQDAFTVDAALLILAAR
jgi:8-oxo-dGTP pyrophosphatase MutT (NUDIX family)